MKAVENAIRKIQSLYPLLDHPSLPINSKTYFDCLEDLIERSKELGKSSEIGIGDFL